MQQQEGSTDRQTAQLVNGNIPYNRCHAQFMNGGWLQGRNLLSLLSFPWV